MTDDVKSFFDENMKLLEDKYPYILDNLVFLNEFEELPNFVSLSMKDRATLKFQYKKKQVPPTRDNMWVWFGCYGAPDQMPVYNRVRVTRLLFQIFQGISMETETPTGKPKVRKLVNSFVTTPCDVNPFKYFYGVGSRVKAQAIADRNNKGVTSLPANHRIKTYRERQVNEALEKIDQFYAPGVTDKPEWMGDLLREFGFTNDTIDEAIKLSPKFQEGYTHVENSQKDVSEEGLVSADDTGPGDNSDVPDSSKMDGLRVSVTTGSGAILSNPSDEEN